MIVDTDFKHIAEQMIPGLMTFFDHNEIPVIFVKKTPADEGDACSFRVFVDGNSVQVGDLSSGSISMWGMQFAHERIFALIREAYDKANR